MISCPNCGTSYPPSVRLCPRDGTVLEGHQPTEERFVGVVLHGKYRLDSYLSSGGMGAVFKATHVMLGKPVAVKLIKADLVTSPDMVRRFQREARAATTLNHPNIVAVYDLGQTDDGTLYIAMELVDGTSLKDVIRETGRIDAPRIVYILRQIASALSLAHRHHIIHRDLKPQNVMLTRDADGREIAKLLDFGIAKTFDEKATQLTQTGFALGTPQYMSPEQAMGKEVDARSDLYSLGVMLYEMLIGEVPFSDPSAPAILVKHMTETPAPPSRRRPDLQVPAHLETIVMKCLEKEPARRYQSADEFIVALESGAGMDPTVPLRAAAPPPPMAATIIMPPPGGGATIPTAAASFAPAMPATATHVPTVPPVSPAAPTIPTAAAMAPSAPTVASPATPSTIPSAPIAASAPVAPPPPPSVAAQAPPSDTRPTVPAGQAVIPAPPQSGSKAGGLAMAAGVLLLLGVAGAGAWYMNSRTADNVPQSAANTAVTAPDAAPTAALPPVTPPTADAGQKDPVPVEAGTAKPSEPPPVSAPATGERPARPIVVPPVGSSSPAAPAPGRKPVEPAASSAPAAQPVAAPTLPAQPSIFIDCQGPGDLCGAVRSAFDQQIESNGLAIARTKDRADIVLVATVGVTGESRDENFVTRSYLLDVVGDAPKLDRAVGMPAARAFSFDARVGRERLNENARAMAVQSMTKVKDFIEKNR